MSDDQVAKRRPLFVEVVAWLCMFQPRMYEYSYLPSVNPNIKTPTQVKRADLKNNEGEVFCLLST